MPALKLDPETIRRVAGPIGILALTDAPIVAPPVSGDDKPHLFDPGQPEPDCEILAPDPSPSPVSASSGAGRAHLPGAMPFNPKPVPALLKPGEVCLMLGIGTSTFYAKIKKDPLFPRPVTFAGEVRYRLEDVQRYIERLPEAVDEPPPPKKKG